MKQGLSVTLVILTLWERRVLCRSSGCHEQGSIPESSHSHTVVFPQCQVSQGRLPNNPLESRSACTQSGEFMRQKLAEPASGVKFQPHSHAHGFSFQSVAAFAARPELRRRTVWLAEL